jgi:hypothetical protein
LEGKGKKEENKKGIVWRLEGKKRIFVPKFKHRVCYEKYNRN